MTTYGRADMVEEALYSFLNQEYEGESELVIVNDYPLQKLIFDHPKVRIINLDKTFPVIGEKENFAIEQCKYNTVYNCDDDDVFLRNHFQNINDYFTNHNLLHWNKGVFMVAHKIEKVGSLGNCGVVYDREYVRSLGGYPREQAGADMTLVVAIGNNGGKIARATPDMPSQIYNWGNGSYHLSGMGRDTDDRENIIVRHSRYIESQRQKGLIPTGDIVLKPHWNRDYEKIVSDYMQDEKIKTENNIGKWNDWYKNLSPTPSAFRYSQTETYQKAADFLSDCKEVEDWGVGAGGFLIYRPDAIGVDGSDTPFAAKKFIDLSNYVSECESIHIRHVFEHNYKWKDILVNAMVSAKKKLAITMFIVLGDNTTEIAHNKKHGVDVPDLKISKDEFFGVINQFNPKEVKVEVMNTPTGYGQEQIIYITK